MAKMKIKVHERNSDNDPQRFYDKLNPVEKRRFDGLADTVEALVGVFDENGKLSKPQQDQLKEARDTIYVFGYAARGYVSLADEVLANYGVEPLLDPNEPVFGESKKTEDAGNAIQQFAGEHGKDTDKSLAKDFQAAVEAVIGDNGKVVDAWVDAPLRNTHSTSWNASIVSDDMEADGREVCVTLYTTFDGRNYLVCDFWDKDGNIIDSVKGDYGDFDLLSMFKKCIGVSESKKNEDTDDAAEALAKELGVSVDKVSDSSQDYDYYEPDYTYDVELTDGTTATYLVYDNQQSAIDAAADDLGERFHDDRSILGAAIEYFGFGTLSDYLNGYDDDEMADLESLCDDVSSEEFASMLQQRGGLDYRGFAEYNIGELGAAWHLSNYDGKEVELENGMLAYRVD